MKRFFYNRILRLKLEKFNIVLRLGYNILSTLFQGNKITIIHVSLLSDFLRIVVDYIL